jgi:DNA-binding XRE family transcriptional regulator
MFSMPEFRNSDKYNRYVNLTAGNLIHRLGFELMQIRFEKEIPQTELAKRVHTSTSTISRIERGKQNISLKELVKIAIALDIPICISLGTGLRPTQIHVPDPAMW